MLLAALLGACTAPAPPLPIPSDVAASPNVPMRAPAGAEAHRLWFVGLAMQSEQWAENDVVETSLEMARSASRYQMRPVLFSDRYPAGPESLRPVLARAVEPELARIGQAMQPDDVAVVYVSTHGAPGLLGRQLEGREAEPVGVGALKRWFEPLRGHDTVLILSACFSGSFIPALAEPHRIIITAARADRPSFGCQAGAEHTVFGEALLEAIAPDTSLHAIVDRTRRAVTATERQLGVPAPSLPQVFVGSAVKPLYDAPVF